MREARPTAVWVPPGRPVGCVLALLQVVLLAALPAPTHATTRRYRYGARSRAGRLRLPSRGQVRHRVRRGETFALILASRGVGYGEAWRWARAAREVYDLARLRPGHMMTLIFGERDGRLHGIRYEVDSRTTLVLELGPGGIRARRQVVPYFVEVRGVAGRISRSLAADGRDAGVPPQVVTELAGIFSQRVDVDGGLQPGDEFRVLFEYIFSLGSGRPRPGKVVAAEMVVGGRRHTAIYFRGRNGAGGYFTPGGDSLERRYLRYPLSFREITSRFAWDRLNPALHIHLPHRAVDFAAPVGTPVRAVGDGRVVRSGWAGPLGRCVRIKHPDGFVSIYGHLHRIARGARRGAWVRRGQVIGYVGATGRATGPHLHFALLRHGVYVDPLRVRLPAGRPVPPSERVAFARVRALALERLDRLVPGGRVVTVSFSPALVSEVHSTLQ